MGDKVCRIGGVHVSISDWISVSLGCTLGSFEQALFKGQTADTLSLPTGIAPSWPLVNGKRQGPQPSEKRSLDSTLVLRFSNPHRPSARFPHQRRKKRREMDDGLAEGGPQRSSE